MSARRTLLAGLVLAFGVVVLHPSPAGGTITEQRRRLPPPAAEDACADPVAGIWRAHVYYPRQRDWYLINLTIRRNGDELTGDIHLRGWPGVPATPEPQPCRPGHEDYVVLQPAKGKVSGLDLEIGGTSWSFGAPFCEKSTSGAYILDTFIGRIDPVLQEFQAVNRYPMGGEMVEDVTVFRRIQCFGSAVAASTPIPAPAPPPAMTPPNEPRSRFGCDCGR